MDVAVWGMNKGLPVRVYSAGGRYGYKDDGKTPNTQACVFTYADGTTLEFEVRGRATNSEGGVGVGNLFYGAGGYFNDSDMTFYDKSGKAIEKAPDFSKDMPPEGNPDINYVDFLKAVRSRKKEDIYGNAEDARISAAHCHLANISYRLGRSLNFDPKSESFSGDSEANALLKDEYRKGFEVPQIA